MLICENQKFVLTEECPPEPHANAPRSVREKYDSWQMANNKARRYMFACMNDVLRTKHENVETIYEIWESLHSMFGRQSDQCRHEATKAYLTTIHEVEIHGATVDEKTQVSVILESLTPAFIPFSI